MNQPNYSWSAEQVLQQRQTGKIRDIQAVQQSVQKLQARSLWLQSGKREFDIVTLQTTKQTVNIGIDLTASECAWLAQDRH